MLTCIFCGQEKLRAERRMGFHYYFCHNCNTTIGWGIPSSVSEGAVEALYKAALSGSPSVPAFPVFDWEKLPIEIYLSDEYIKKAWQEWESSLLNTCADFRQERKMSEADKLRRNFARYLASSYLKNPYETAEICDKELDRSGTLLGYVRDEARALKSAQGNAAEVGSAGKASTERRMDEGK